MSGWMWFVLGLFGIFTVDSGIANVCRAVRDRRALPAPPSDATAEDVKP